MTTGPRPLPQRDYVRHKLFSGNRSTLQRYSELVIGGGSFWTLLKYELITVLFGPLPGALGLLLRRTFYPLLFERIGNGVVFGRNVVIRNPKSMTLGDRVLIDDNCLIDARGAGPEGLVIGRETVIHRGASVQAKVGPVHIGSHSDVGAGSSVLSQGGTYIGDMVSLGGGCKVGGGLIQLGSAGTSSGDETRSTSDFEARGQERLSRGPIHIGDRCALSTAVTVLDGVTIGEGTVVDACAVIREDVPPNSVVMPNQKLIITSRTHFGGGSRDAQPPRGSLQADQGGAAADPGAGPHATEGRGTTAEAVTQTVFRTIELLNERLPPTARVKRDLRAPLLEPGGPLDSLGLINLVVAVEEALENEHGVSVALFDGDEDTAERRPFETVGSFVDHVHSLLTQHA